MSEKFKRIVTSLRQCFDDVVKIMKDQEPNAAASALQVEAALKQVRELKIKLDATAAELDATTAERDKFEKLSMFDTLTGVYSKDGFEEQVNNSFARIARGSLEEGAYILVDLDKFKPINDTYGHNVGDDALATFAGTLSGVLRSGDVVGRIGGDEFAIFLTAKKDDNNFPKDAVARIEKEMAEVCVQAVKNGQTVKIPVRASYGAQLVTKETLKELEDYEGVKGAADAVMYEIKESKGGARNKPRSMEEETAATAAETGRKPGAFKM